MSEIEQIIVETTTRLFADQATPAVLNAAEQGGWPQALWHAVAELGLPLALVPEADGGHGLEPEAALAVVRVAARFAVPLPLAETLWANRLLAAAGLPLAEGPASFAVSPEGDLPRATRAAAGWHLEGSLARVPWGGQVDVVVALATHDEAPMLVRLPRGAFTVTPGDNLAGEPRDDIAFSCDLPADACAPAPAAAARLLEAGAALRTVQMAGALEKVLELSVRYAGERVQFGRPIGRFQAVQQNLAMLAGQAAVADGAAGLAINALAGTLDVLPIAIGKARAGEAASIACAITHQVHGAIGFTHEHELHRFTRRLWSWRDEFGADVLWNTRVGAAVAAAGADGLWPLITAA
ncbi:acyl-CoA/acyl-ACP dehydrogenase [Xanthobacter dioxanivorans]|uniref:Acyl-CoA/acyl-ACP dehydrogenase n=1 Tax=Xanthobacter dioxanivorans TaxID=2528964 RepID=A0A974SHR3_9HYPH|nr:acyl-CoA dehydrogenase family protein [Xanthobacter dioxanivorans]QRG04643.1 acyl-CoA/acyl-ACP dehydrogenase [Xanthobacter dioxanivorans]